MTEQNEFARLWGLGYRTLVPIIPPDASISEGSTLHKRVGTHQDARGKVPGVKGRDGKWHSFDWLPYQTDEADLERWQHMGAGVGIRPGYDEATDTTLIAIDADATVEQDAIHIRDVLQNRFGKSMPVRVGRHPKALYLCRVNGRYQYTRIEFGPRDAKGNCDRVEILSDGRQFVAEGIHPKTRQPYTWPRPLCPEKDLPIFDPQDIDDALLEMVALLPQAEPKLIREGAASDVNQKALTGDLARVRAAVEALPNTSALFPSREDYTGVGYAIKAALPDNEPEAFEIFADWCDRWVDDHGRTNDPDVTASDWARMKPPFKRGASYIYELADKHSDGQFTRGDAWFDPVPIAITQTTVFEAAAALEKAETAGDVYPLLRISDLMQRDPPTFLIENYIPQTSLGFLVAPPGVAKTFVALDMALSIAHGLEQWHGNKISPSGDGSVVYIASEGSHDLPLRIGAWLEARGVDTFSDKFIVLEASVNFMDTASVDKFLRSINAIEANPSMIVIDTVSRALPGADENLQKDMSLFILACERVQRSYGCAVMGVHHTSKAGEMRGSSVLPGASDFLITLERKKGDSHGQLTMFKLKFGPDGWHRTFRLTDQNVGPKLLPKAFLEKKPVWGSLVFDLLDASAGGGAEGVGPDVAALVLGAIERDWNAGKPWSMAPQAKDRYAPRLAWVEFNLRAEDAECLFKTWIAAGLIEVREVSARNKSKGLYVVRYVRDTEGEGGVFG